MNLPHIMMELVTLVLANLWLQCEAIHFERCGLVKTLRKLNFTEKKLSDWVCLVEHTSDRNTEMVTVNVDGSHNYGIFQINDKYWCSKTDKPDKDCYVTCAELMSDDITAAAHCALKIYQHEKFNSWYGWRTHCKKPGSLPNIKNCGHLNGLLPPPFFHP